MKNSELLAKDLSSIKSSAFSSIGGTPLYCEHQSSLSFKKFHVTCARALVHHIEDGKISAHQRI
jgi:hypothetical protein